MCLGQSSEHNTETPALVELDSTRWRQMLKKESKVYSGKMTRSVTKKSKTRKGDRTFQGRERGWRGAAIFSWVVREALSEKVCT